MRTILLVIAASALLGGVAQAKDGPNGAPTRKQLIDWQHAQPAVKVLYICGEDEGSWRAFSRDIAAPPFVTAEQVRADQGKAWSGPKCITATQARRLAMTRPMAAR